MGNEITKVSDFYSKVVGGGDWVTSGKDVQYKLENGVLYLQGSQSFIDWLYNLQFGVIPYKDMEETFRVHRGFLALWKSIRKEIQKLDFEIIVGYSQGAAIAGFVHEDFLFRKGYQPITLAIGCPGFIWGNISESLAKRFTNFYRFSGPHDIVTKVPPELWGYKKPGPNTILKVKEKIKRPEDYSRLLWLLGHMPPEYKARLIAAEKEGLISEIL